MAFVLCLCGAFAAFVFVRKVFAKQRRQSIGRMHTHAPHATAPSKSRRVTMCSRAQEFARMEMIAIDAQQRAEQRHERGPEPTARPDANKPYGDRTPLR